MTHPFVAPLSDAVLILKSSDGTWEGEPGRNPCLHKDDNGPRCGANPARVRHDCGSR